MTAKTPHSERAHAKLSPSAAHRWIECPGSIRECEGIPSSSSKFADEGTAAHELAEKCFNASMDADQFIGEKIRVKDRDDPSAFNDFEVTDEMASAVQVYLDVVREIAFAHPLVEFEIEARLDLSDVPGMTFGTGDFSAYDGPIKKLTIADYKHGRGVPVDVKSNPQLLAYALGVVKRYHNRGVKEVELVVVQPRCPHADGSVRRYVCSALDLLEFQGELSEAARRTSEPNAALHPGDWCKFCPAAFKCRALAMESLGVAAAAFSSGDDNGALTSTPPTEPDSLSPSQLREVLIKASVVRGWVDAVERHALLEATHGRVVPGFKLVANRAMRHWKNEADVQEYLGVLFTEDEYAPRKLVSPAKADKLLGKKKGALGQFIEKKSSGTVLVPESDPRPAVAAGAEAFADGEQKDD